METRSKKVWLGLIALVLAYIGLRFYQEKTKAIKGQELVDNYRFYQAMDYYDRLKVEDEEDALDELYYRSNKNKQVAAYLEEKGYPLRRRPLEEEITSLELDPWESQANSMDSQAYYDLILSLDQQGEDYSSLLDYDFRKLEFFQKLNLLGLVEDKDIQEKIQASLASNLIEVYYSSSGKNYHRESPEENDYGFFQREMEDRNIKSYLVYYSYLNKYRDIVLGLGPDQKCYIYSIDGDFLPKYLGSFTGRPEKEPINFRTGLLVAKETTALVYQDKGQSYLLSMVEGKAGIDLSLSQLGDDRLQGDFVESSSLDKKIPLGPGRLEISYNTGSPGVFYRIYTSYDDKGHSSAMLVAQYQVNQYGKVELVDLRQAL